MSSIVDIFLILLDLLWYLLLAQVILSWLTVFGIRNDLLRQITLAVSLLTQPILDPIRKALPRTGSFDFSVLAAFILIYIIIRGNMMENHDVVIVGAGPAGVGMSAMLTDFGIEKMIAIERGKVGETFDRWPE